MNEFTAGYRDPWGTGFWILCDDITAHVMHCQGVEVCPVHYARWDNHRMVELELMSGRERRRALQEQTEHVASVQWKSESRAFVFETYRSSVA